MPRATRLLCLLALLAGIAAALPAFAADHEDIFLANTLVARLRDPGKFASLEERAAKVESILVDVLSDQDTMHPKVTYKQEKGVWVVYSGTVRVLSVLPKDASGSGRPAKALAQYWANNLRTLLPLATPPSRMGKTAPKPGANPATPPAVGTRPAVVPPPATAPEVPAVCAPVAPVAAPLTRQAALVVLLDALNQARALPEDQYLLKREALAGGVLTKLQPFMAGLPATAPPAPIITPPPAPAAPTPPSTTEVTPAAPAAPAPEAPAATVACPAQVNPLPADLAGLPVDQRVSRKFALCQQPYEALRTTNAPLYAQVGALLAQARQAKAAYKWPDAEALLDQALGMLGYKIG
jgi:hypothetical protein